MAHGTIGALFEEGLHALYDAHRQASVQIAANIRSTTFPKLRSLLRTGAKQNLAQARRLDAVFKAAKLRPRGQHDAAMQGIVDANQRMVTQAPGPASRDLVTIASGQIAAHFYLATYGTLRSYAQQMGNKKAARLLGQTIDEAAATDQALTKLARQITALVRTGQPAPAGSPLRSLAGMVGLAVLAVLAAAGDRHRAD